MSGNAKEVTKAQIDGLTDKIKEWAIRKWMQDNKFVSHPDVTPDLNKTPNPMNPTDVDAIPTPEEWAKIKSGFDWIKPAFLDKLKPEASEFEGIKNTLDKAKNVLKNGAGTETGANLKNLENSVDEWGGNYDSIAQVFRAELWAGEAGDRFRTEYVNELPNQAANTVQLMGMLYAAVDCNQALIKAKYSELAAIGNATVKTLAGARAPEEGSGLPEWFWPVTGALVGITITVLTAGTATPIVAAGIGAISLGAVDKGVDLLKDFNVGVGEEKAAKEAAVSTVKISGGMSTRFSLR